MSTFLGLTQATAQWILTRVSVLDQLHKTISVSNLRDLLSQGDFIEGPIRMSYSRDLDTVLLWHADYLSGTGNEDWGFIEISGDAGILNNLTVSREVLERSIYVCNQRLQGLFIDGAFIHRSYPNGTHSCLAGRGNEARQLSIGYIENKSGGGSGTIHSILCVGPLPDLQRLASVTLETGALLPKLVMAATSQIDPRQGRRPIVHLGALAELQATLSPHFESTVDAEFGEVNISVSSDVHQSVYGTTGMSIDDWLKPSSSLSSTQRRLLESDALEKHPIRIMGPGGSGKTLLMQLLALQRIILAKQRQQPIRILYLVHNSKMADSVNYRFTILEGFQGNLIDGNRILHVKTLSEYGRTELSLDDTQVIDSDAGDAKEFQLQQVEACLKETLDQNPLTAESDLFLLAKGNSAVFSILTKVLMAEFSTAIKGHGLIGDEKRYVHSERRLSRLHGALSTAERRLVFDVFKKYHAVMFTHFRVLDSDDMALSLLGRLRAPVWELKRLDLGYDYVFVDEAQLFNENERRLFSLLTKKTFPYVPIVLALDEAQEIYGQSMAGIATLGIENVASESLSSIHRSTRSIIQLAFFVIQRSTDLFGPDFPNYTGIAEHMEEDAHPLAHPPCVITASSNQSLGRFIVKQIRTLRRNIRRIGVICFAEQYWMPLINELKATDLPLQVLERRGERLSSTEPVVAVSRPAYIGGQEFDAVILVGLEEGITPPRIQENDALASAIEQQSLREIYLGITRARFRLQIALSNGAELSPVLADAKRAGLIQQLQTPI